jgi:hypothetical protein
LGKGAALQRGALSAVVVPMKCPICKGKGCLSDPRKVGRDRTAEKKAMAKTLRDAGYSIRQIQEFLGYKSPRSIALFLESNTGTAPDPY